MGGGTHPDAGRSPARVRRRDGVCCRWPPRLRARESEARGRTPSDPDNEPALVRAPPAFAATGRREEHPMRTTTATAVVLAGAMLGAPAAAQARSEGPPQRVLLR